MQCARVPEDPNLADPGLGGQLLYVGELDASGRALAVAANIAGAATLAASVQPANLRLAQREGVIDFLVNSLDEALRILKNEIRKRQPVAVAVSHPPAVIESEMLARGVLPDLLPPLPALASFQSQGAKQIPAPTPRPQSEFLVWPIPGAFTQSPAAFDALLAGHLPPGDLVNRRWLRLSPRYLGPAARRLRSLAADARTAKKLIASLGTPLE